MSRQLSVIVFLAVSSNQAGFMTALTDYGLDNIEICSSKQNITLSDHGSSRTITLSSPEVVHEVPCTLRISAPESHVVHLQFLENNLELHRAMSNGREFHHPPCYLRIYLPENQLTPVWKGDLCSINSLPQVDLLTPQITLSWDPPDDALHLKGRKILLTTVGKGDACKTPNQHTCMRIGWEPILCVSDSLLCDGRQDCPKGSTTSDEDEEMCKKYLVGENSWKRIAADILKNLQLQNNNVNKWLKQIDEEEGTGVTEENGSAERKKIFVWKDWKEIVLEGTTKPPYTDTSQPSVGAMLSQYGPWGYLVLGMLLCGSLLILCGLWECWIRRHKNEPSPPPSPTTLVIVNGYDDVQPPHPPDYQDLDLPPSYTVLFPGEAKDPEESEEDVDVESISLTSINGRQRAGASSVLVD